MRNRVLVGAIVGALGVACIPAPSLGAQTRARTAVPDVTVLFGRAVKTIRNTNRPTFARAVVLEADGITKGGRCTPLGCSGGRGATSAAGFVSWRFVFDNGPSRSRFQSATITYGPPPKAFGAVRGFKPAFEEDIVIPRSPKLTLAQAVALVRRAGHRAPFFNVALRNPLGPNPHSHPLYIFGFAGNHYFAVDTVTKRVRPFG
jgi:hypothetical protein